jgi:ABC-2 type transport system permease protein
VTWILLAETWVFIKSLRRRKDLLFWLIVFPVVYMLLVNAIFAPREAPVSFKIAVMDEDGSVLSRALVNAMNESGIFELRLLSASDPGELQELLRRGEYPLILVIPRGFHNNITGTRQAKLEVYYNPNSRDSLTALRVLEDLILHFENMISSKAADTMLNYVPEPFKSMLSGYISFLVDPIRLAKFNVTGASIAEVTRAFKLSLVTLTIGLMLLYTGIMGGLHAIAEKRYEGYIQSILSSRVKPSTFLLSEVIAITVGGLVSASVITLTGLMLGAPILEVPLHKILVALALILVSVMGLIGFGLTIGIVAKTPQSASALGNAIAFPIMFLGGFTIPKFMLPSWLQVFPELFPHSRLVYAITYYVLGDWSLEETVVYALPAIALSLTLLLAGALVYRRVLERLLGG